MHRQVCTYTVIPNFQECMQPQNIICIFNQPRRIAKATGATVVLTLADIEGNETFDASSLGTAEEVAEERVSDDSMVGNSWGGGVEGAGS